jgi:hypothetical protein
MDERLQALEIQASMLISSLNDPNAQRALSDRPNGIDVSGIWGSRTQKFLWRTLTRPFYPHECLGETRVRHFIHMTTDETSD